MYTATTKGESNWLKIKIITVIWIFDSKRHYELSTWRYQLRSRNEAEERISTLFFSNVALVNIRLCTNVRTNPAKSGELFDPICIPKVCWNPKFDKNVVHQKFKHIKNIKIFLLVPVGFSLSAWIYIFCLEKTFQYL